MYAVLYFSPEPLSPAAIARDLRVSKANVSINLKKLEEWNAVRRVWRKGYVRSLYQANDEPLQIIMDRLEFGIGKRLALVQTTLNRVASKLPRNNFDSHTRLLRKRLKEMENLLQHITFFLGKTTGRQRLSRKQ